MIIKFFNILDTCIVCKFILKIEKGLYFESDI